MVDALKIILGVGATAVAFYFTSSMLLAQKHLIAATRVSGYLTYWQNWIIERDLFGIYYLGMKWNQEIQEIVKKRGGPEEVLKLQQEKKKILSQVKEELEKEGIEFDHEKLVREIQRLPK